MVAKRRGGIPGSKLERHGMRHSVEYRAWNLMKQRCTNENDKRFDRYGGRGIKVSPSWIKFSAFFQDVGPRPGPDFSLDRIDNDGDYEPGNVRWATREIQSRNKSCNKMLTMNGETRCATDWANLLGLNPALVCARILKGWTVERALSPARKWTHRKVST